MPENERIPVRRNKRTPAGQKREKSEDHYGTRDYDHLYFNICRPLTRTIAPSVSLAANLDPDTTQLAAGGNAVCAFVNSDCGAETLSVLAKAGVER